MEERDDLDVLGRLHAVASWSLFDLSDLDEIRPADEEGVVSLPAEVALHRIRSKRSLGSVDVGDPLIGRVIEDLHTDVVGPCDKRVCPSDRVDWSFTSMDDLVFAREPSLLVEQQLSRQTAAGKVTIPLSRKLGVECKGLHGPLVSEAFTFCTEEPVDDDRPIIRAACNEFSSAVDAQVVHYRRVCSEPPNLIAIEVQDVDPSFCCPQRQELVMQANGTCRFSFQDIRNAVPKPLVL
mmetsp:Transcript_31199/g.100098  ORF Transcript_31199/g.100098 Transcript_31199/m.100098 type:complete len:237 (+) Transcript_31199:1899-2609(+)